MTITEKLCECGCGAPAVYAASHVHKRLRDGIHPADYRVMDTGFTSPCWVWKGKLLNSHVNVRVRGKQLLVHRAMYEQEIGPIPKGLVLDHLCCVKRCLNPAHLEPVTSGENSRRALRKLSDEAIQVIRTGGGNARVLARHYGVSEFAIYQVRSGRTYAEVHSDRSTSTPA